VRAAGLTVEQLRTELIEKCATQVRKPEVSIEIVDFGSQPVSVMGAVNHPGVLQLQGRKTLAEVLSMAGGLTQDAGPRVKISREVRYGAIPLSSAKADSTSGFSVAEVDVKDLLTASNPAVNIPVCPHDVITVPSAEKVFVIGQVRKPGTFVLEEKKGISVLQALSMAEGLGTAPAPQKSKILRAIPGQTERQQIPVNLSKILEGKAEDLEMRPNDILVVPSSSPKRAAARALEAAIQTATGVVIWRRP